MHHTIHDCKITNNSEPEFLWEKVNNFNEEDINQIDQPSIEDEAQNQNSSKYMNNLIGRFNEEDTFNYRIVDNEKNPENINSQAFLPIGNTKLYDEINCSKIDTSSRRLNVLNESHDMFEDTNINANKYSYLDRSAGQHNLFVVSCKENNGNTGPKDIRNYFPVIKKQINNKGLYRKESRCGKIKKKNTKKCQEDLALIFNRMNSAFSNRPKTTEAVDTKSVAIKPLEKQVSDYSDASTTKHIVPDDVFRANEFINKTKGPERTLRNLYKPCSSTTVSNESYSFRQLENQVETFKESRLNESYVVKCAQISSEHSSVKTINISSVNSESIMDELRSDSIAEIGITLCYRGDYSLLYKTNTTTCLPTGILLCSKYLDGSHKMFFCEEKNLKDQIIRSIVLEVLGSLTRKICFEAQALIIYLLDNLELNDKRMCYNWCILDPLLGAWLLDPDNPPSSFFELLKLFFNCKNLLGDKNLTLQELMLQQSLVMETIYNQLMKENLWDVFLYLDTKIIPILAVMEASSILIDKKNLQKMSILLKEKLNNLECDAEKLIGHKISMNSPQQLRQVLYEELKLDKLANVTIKGTTVRGNKSTSEPVLKLLINFHPLPELIMKYRLLYKMKFTYTDIILTHAKKENRISAIWELYSAATGRITSRNPNLQSIPKQSISIKLKQEEIQLNLRSCFIADNNKVFISVDFQHIELRVFALLANDSTLINLLRKEGDIFKTMTELRLQKEDISSEERTQTKTLIYALMYGAGVKKIAEILSLDQIQAENVRNAFLGIFPSLQDFNRKILNEARKTKLLKSLSGRKRAFPNIMSGNSLQRRLSERQAINFIVQGSAADICKGAMLRTELRLKEKHLNAKLLLQIHDELLWEVNEHDAVEFNSALTSSSLLNTYYHRTKNSTSGISPEGCSFLQKGAQASSTNCIVLDI